LKYSDFSFSVLFVDQLSLDTIPAHPRRSVHARLPSEGELEAKSFPLKRKTRRVSCNAHVQLDAAGRSLIGVCNDISLGGMLFLGPILPVGERVDVSMDFPIHGRIRVLGEILEHRQHAKGSGMAVRFTRLGPNELALLVRFVADQLAPSR
jgi:hypothetical protein